MSYEYTAAPQMRPLRPRRPRLRCRRCRSRYPSYMIVGGMGGYPMMGGMGMNGMSGMGMNMPMMAGMGGMGGMGMGMYPGMMGGYGMGMGMNMPMMTGMMSGYPQVIDGGHHRRLIEQDIDIKEYKIIQKCVVFEDKHICLTYSYFDTAISLDYYVKNADNRDNRDNGNKYYQTFIWIWKKDGAGCNDQLGNVSGEICLRLQDEDIIVEINGIKIILNEQNVSEIYNVKEIDNDEFFTKKRLCNDILSLAIRLCVEMDDNHSNHVDEIKVFVQTMVIGD